MQYLASSNSTFNLSNFLDKGGVQGMLHSIPNCKLFYYFSCIKYLYKMYKNWLTAFEITLNSQNTLEMLLIFNSLTHENNTWYLKKQKNLLNYVNNYFVLLSLNQKKSLSCH